MTEDWAFKAAERIDIELHRNKIEAIAAALRLARTEGGNSNSPNERELATKYALEMACQLLEDIGSWKNCVASYRKALEAYGKP